MGYAQAEVTKKPRYCKASSPVTQNSRRDYRVMPSNTQDYSHITSDKYKLSEVLFYHKILEKLAGIYPYLP